MPDWRSRISHRGFRLGLAAIALLLSGLTYYLIWRILPTSLADYSAGAYPSLVHMLSLTWLAFALTGIKRGLPIATVLLIASLISERFIGYFYTHDALMLIGGYAIGIVTAYAYLRLVPVENFKIGTVLTAASLTGISTVFILGSGCIYCGDVEVRTAKPVYLSYQELRSNGVTVSPPRPLSDISRVYIYQSTLFLNSKNNGIHVLDNSDPANPQNIGFIAIPGNTELSIRSNYLYADSYVDLVTINISDPQNVFEQDRDIDIFPYDAYQNIPDNVYFGYDGVDESRGVVVSYERTN